MKLWIGGELEADIVDSFRDARRNVEKAINNGITANAYSSNLKSWDCIAILRSDEAFKEIFKYSKKTGEMDFRLKLNYLKFKEGGQLERERMVFDMIQRSLAILKEKEAFRDDRLSLTVLDIGRNNNWV